MADKTEFESAYEMGARNIEIKEVNDFPIAFAPAGVNLMVLEQLLPRPSALHSIRSFRK